MVCISAVSSLLFNWLYSGEIPRYQHFVVDSTVKEIDSRQAFLIHRAQQAVFIDSRSQKDYDSIHIKDAVSLPYHSPREFKFEVMEKFSPNSLFVVYCKNASCEIAGRLSGQLNFIGYKRIIVYRDGIDDWQAKGYPLERGAQNE